MDITNYTTEHKKGQHLLSEERHEIEVRLKDGWSICRIAKHLGRPYNTVKNEIKRGTVSLYQGKVQRYKADEGKKVYLEHRQNCRKQYRCLATIRFLQYVVERFQSDDHWSLDASCGEAMRNGTFPRSEMVCTKTLYNYVDLGLLPIKNIDLPEKLRRNTKAKKAPNPTDTTTLPPFLDRVYEKSGHRIENVIADAGYASEENYTYLEKNKQNAYIKPADHEVRKTRKFKNDIYNVENMLYNKDSDSYTCPKSSSVVRKLKESVRTGKFSVGASKIAPKS